ncbi:MAG: hypothetical protein ACKVU2_08170 [Saprospiraceae bacterium]
MTDYEKQHYIERWEAKREKGRLIFVVRMAVFFLVAMSVVAVLVDLFDQSFSEAVSSNLKPIRLLLHAISGTGLGFLNWYLMERQYRKLKAQP